MAATAPGSPCPSCGGTELYQTIKPISSSVDHSSDPLTGLHPWYRMAKVHTVVCARCGLYRQFAEPEARERVRDSAKWQRV